MKKIYFSITASVIYTVIGALSTISNLVHRASINGKNYDYEFGFLAHIGNILIDAALGLLNLLFCIPELATGLIAGTLSFIALHLYNKGNTAQRLCGRCKAVRRALCGVA